MNHDPIASAESISEELLTDISLDADIPGTISLKRIKKRALSGIQAAPKRTFKRMAVLPLVALISIISISVFAASQNFWGVFFNNAKVVQEDVQKIGQTKTFDNIKMTVDEAVFSANSGIILFTLERTDGGRIDTNTLPEYSFPQFSAPGYTGSFSCSDSRHLSADGKKITTCLRIQSGGNLNLAPGTLKLNIGKIECDITTTPKAGFPLDSITSDAWEKAVSAKDLAGMRALSQSGSQYLHIEGVESLHILGAGYADGKLNLVLSNTKSGSNTKNNEWVYGLFDSRTSKIMMPSAYNIADKSEGNSLETAEFSGVSPKDLPFLYPIITVDKLDRILTPNWIFDIQTNKKMDEISAENGLHPIKGIDELTLKEIKISPLGVQMSAASADKPDIINRFMEKSAYCLMEDGTKVPLVQGGLTSSSSPGGSIYELNFIVRDTLLDTLKVKAFYIDDSLIWEK